MNFGYRESLPVLRDINLDFPAGAMVALVGPTGAGKTSIANLIARFYDVSDGAVCIDDIDIREVKQRSMREQMGLVSQDPFIFAGTIAAQTALKLEDCPARIEAWAEAALSVNSNIIVLAHGGPIADPADADFIMKQTRNCHGFYGASSMERLPVERALTEQVRKFKAIGAR